MRIDDLPEDEFISLCDANGKIVECRILGRTIYENDEYIVCAPVYDEYAYMVSDARVMEGQMIPISEITIEEVIDKFLTEHLELKQEKKVDLTESGEEEGIVLTDEYGNAVRVVILDFIEEQDKCYVVCMEEDEAVEEVIIMEVREIGEELEEYFIVEDETLLAHVFEVFKERNADCYNFI